MKRQGEHTAACPLATGGQQPGPSLPALCPTPVALRQVVRGYEVLEIAEEEAAVEAVACERPQKASIFPTSRVKGSTQTVFAPVACNRCKCPHRPRAGLKKNCKQNRTVCKRVRAIWAGAFVHPQKAREMLRIPQYLICQPTGCLGTGGRHAAAWPAAQKLGALAANTPCQRSAARAHRPPVTAGWSRSSPSACQSWPQTLCCRPHTLHARDSAARQAAGCQGGGEGEMVAAGVLAWLLPGCWRPKQWAGCCRDFAA